MVTISSKNTFSLRRRMINQGLLIKKKFVLRSNEYVNVKLSFPVCLVLYKFYTHSKSCYIYYEI